MLVLVIRSLAQARSWTRRLSRSVPILLFYIQCSKTPESVIKAYLNTGKVATNISSWSQFMYSLPEGVMSLGGFSSGGYELHE